MCKRLFFLLAMCILVGAGTNAFAASFPDTNGTPYTEAFAYLSSNDIVHGYPDGTARPNGYLNRAEALKVILGAQDRYKTRVEWMQGNLLDTPLFYDIDQSQWYAPYVEVAFEHAVVTGYPDGSFRPGQLLRVEEAIALLMRAYGEQGGSAALESPYIQNRSSEWFTPYVNTVIERNLVMHRGNLRLGTAITRGQFFDMVYRMHSIHSTGLLAYDGPEPAPAPVTVASNTYIPAAAPAPVITTQQPAISVSAVEIATGLSIEAGQPGGSTAGISTGGDSVNAGVFTISMPTLGINNLAVIHPDDPFSSEGVLAPLQYGVGHLFSYPGGGGKIMIYGHSSGYAWDVSPYTQIFRRANELNPGDRLYVNYQGQEYVYEVTHEQTIDASDNAPFNDNGDGEELILYTCWPPDSIAQRYLIHARPV